MGERGGAEEARGARGAQEASEARPGVSVRLLEERAKRLGRAGERGPLALGVNSRILELEPDHLGALTRRARCNLACDDYPAARADFERALALNPKSALHRQQLREGLREVEEGWEAAERRRRSREGRYDRRQALFREIEEIAEFAEARALGVLYSGGIRGGPGRGALGIDRALAAAAFRRAYHLDPRRRVAPGGRPDPGLFEVPTRLAAVYRAQDKPAQAARVYEWVLSHHDSPLARVGLAAVREDQGRHEEALGHYERVLSERPRDAYALRGVGRVLSSLGRDEEAIAAFERAARLADDAGAAERARSSLARLKAALERQGRTEQAKAAAEALGRMGAV